MDSDQLSPNTRSLRSRSNVTYCVYLPSRSRMKLPLTDLTKDDDLPPETIEAMSSLTHPPYDADLGTTIKRSIEFDTESKDNRSSEVDTGTKNNGSIVVDTRINNEPVAKTSDTTLEATGSTIARSSLVTIAKIKAKIATEHAYSEILTQARRRLWEQIESYEAHIRENQRKICESDEGVDQLNKRLHDCEILDSQIAELCKLLKSLGEQLDERSDKVVDLLSELSKAG
ncbi:hypothetical protein SNK03_009069 [Fusarium graminearum]|uniref:Chromosome 4, complete genome n=2 Tax=Gibberella zeae TaxID=5518 RepID=I1RTX5_GIBZE|nr:hypothetical protein FGSG_07644 [Fusarium graminearum PH-1]CAF3450022.1 unnamed protein product [Fusarium graminearum]ESU13924.1 hypothetical protein FGSG_07644 [Fusarium graminearum PH-1]CAF3455411.1 unnamed protein product [Fusarium graminearum]CAF3528339.1 unnamed protein product [Fusarium graminearum]CAG1984082.1 unnamed protein product [Fusarium graminearum]|eukprot:XP_011327431.1 hypothetical protein FGSG_07644 [Fusarium graminearum PH-1]